jgi:hypothetical protein
VRFDHKTVFLDFEKRCSLLQHAGFVVVNLEVFGLAHVVFQHVKLFESDASGSSKKTATVLAVH